VWRNSDTRKLIANLFLICSQNLLLFTLSIRGFANRAFFCRVRPMARLAFQPGAPFEAKKHPESTDRHPLRWRYPSAIAAVGALRG
jgi:hypothetical protein